MATKLAQILAVEKGVKSDSHSALTRDYQRLGKTDQFYGLSRTHQPLLDTDVPFPSESTRVQVTVDEVLKNAAKQRKCEFDPRWGLHAALWLNGKAPCRRSKGYP